MHRQQISIILAPGRRSRNQDQKRQIEGMLIFGYGEERSGVEFIGEGKKEPWSRKMLAARASKRHVASRQ